MSAPTTSSPEWSTACLAEAEAAMALAEPDARPAGIVSRGLGAVIDLIVVLLVIGMLYVGLILARLVYSPAAFRLPDVNAVFSTLVTFAVAVLYLTACWAVSGRTVGHVTMGLRVVGRRSLRVHPLVALLRAVACVRLPHRPGLGRVGP